MPAEKLRLRIGNLAKAVLVSGQAYQDPKDALNEFVSNAADEYAQSERRGGRVRVLLRRKGRYPVIAVDDLGRGMSPERLRTVARSLFESSKAGDTRTLGEKAIGILAFQQLGGRCEIVSRAEGSPETWVLRLERGKVTAVLERERRRARPVPGTTVYLSDLDPDVLRVLTQRKVVDYLRARRGPALSRGDFEIEVVEGRSSELVLPEKPDGVRLAIAPRNTLWGRIEFALYVAPHDERRRRVAVVGRAGTTVLDDLSELDEFAGHPWGGDQVSGQVIFEALLQTAGRRAILRDREAFPLFVDAVKAVEPAVAQTVERVAREVDAKTSDRLADVIRRIFDKVLKELADLDNPMRSPGGVEPGEGGLLEAREPEGTGDGLDRDGQEPPPDVGDLMPPPMEPVASNGTAGSARPDRPGSSRLPSVAPDPNPGEPRSRFDAETGVVFFNDRHSDYLMVKDSEAMLLDYLATLVAKEYVVYNNPRASTGDLGEELVRVLVRVRRHIPRRR
ncbi:MAG: ATP-binding protein [Acidimicrobiales bacterium]